MTLTKQSRYTVVPLWFSNIATGSFAGISVASTCIYLAKYTIGFMNTCKYHRTMFLS